MAVKPTISDVAARAGVSKGAVSFALNGRSGVSPETRARILQAAQELGFVPNANARALSTRRSGSLGLVFARRPEMFRSDPFFVPFIAGIESAISPTGHLLVLRFVGDDGYRGRGLSGAGPDRAGGRRLRHRPAHRRPAAGTVGGPEDCPLSP